MVLCDGVFDPVHVGHIEYLQAARDRFVLDADDDLVVNIAPDTYVRLKHQLFQREDERAVTLESLLAMRRAGADILITYAATDVARWLAEK